MIDDQEAVSESLRALTQFLVSESTLRDTLLRVCEMACAVTPAHYAGITLIVEGRPRTGVFTHPDAPEIDEAQYESGEGPCMYAFRDQQVYRIESMAHEERWPEFARAALAHNVHSTLSLPLSALGKGLGALNLYSHEAAAFTEKHEQLGLTFADQASIVLANAMVYWDARELSENLTEAIKTREVISQAVGILMAAGGRTPDAAFQILASASQRENRKVRDIASEIVTRTVQRHTDGSL